MPVNIADEVMKLIEADQEKQIFLATCTSMLADRVTIQRPGQLAPDGQTYRTISRAPVAVGDTVVCLRKSGSVIVLGAMGAPRSSIGALMIPLSGARGTIGTIPTKVLMGAGDDQDEGWSFAGGVDSGLVVPYAYVPGDFASGLPLTARLDWTVANITTGIARWRMRLAAIGPGESFVKNQDATQAASDGVPGVGIRATTSFGMGPLVAEPGTPLRIVIERVDAAGSTAEAAVLMGARLEY